MGMVLLLYKKMDVVVITYLLLMWILKGRVAL